MYCDALTLAAVADELRRELLGGRIQRVVLVDRYIIGLEVFAHNQRHYLLLSSAPEEGGRIHLVRERLRRGTESPSPLLLRLRKCACSGHLIDVKQPPWERILTLTIQGSEGTVFLVAEIMGRRSNLILLGQDGTILECARRVPASKNRYRVLLPAYPYVPPPRQKKLDVSSLTPAILAKALDDQDPTLPAWRKLVASVSAVSPLLAREVACRASGNAECQQADAAAITEHLKGLLGLAATGNWQPSVALQEDMIVAYAPYLLTQYPVREARATMSEPMTAYYSQRVGGDAYAVAKSIMHDLIASQRDRQVRKKEALLRAYPSQETLEELRRDGELLLAYGHQALPGQSELAIDWDGSGSPVHIALDPTRSAVENAKEYFRSYEKAKSAAAGLPPLLAEVGTELAYLDQLSTDLALAEDQPGIAAVESAMAEAGYVPRPKKPRPPVAAPLRMASEDGFTILVGRNSWQNEEVTFRHSTGHDIWLHAQGVPGAHVVIRTEGREVPESALRQAAELAATYSAARHDKRVLVDYTLRKEVHRLKGGRQGQVVYRRQKTIRVRPDAGRRS